MIEILPTNTCPPDLDELAKRSKRFSEFAPAIQLDISDGKFTPAISWPYNEGQLTQFEAMAQKGETLPLSDSLQYEVHLMVEEPLHIGEGLARMHCSRIIAHVETFQDADKIRLAFEIWKRAGASEVGLALLFDTLLSKLEGIAERCDVVQLMSIAKLGFQGAPYEAGIVPRIQELRKAYPDLVIEIDGGVSGHNIQDLVRAGATRFGVGSAISKAPDPAAACIHMKALAEEALPVE